MCCVDQLSPQPAMGSGTTIISLLSDLATFLWLALRPQRTLAAENLFLCKQLAMFQERQAKPRRPDAPLRIALVLLSRLFNWRNALVVVQPQTLIRWHRQGFPLFWRWKSRPGRPPIPTQIRQLIHEMTMNNPSWGEERIAHDRDGIFPPHLDHSISCMGIRVLRSPPGNPKAKGLCERVIGTLRREFRDYFIPITESHLRWHHKALGVSLQQKQT
jgi:putative transposase